MINTVSTVRNNTTTSKQRFDREKVSTSVLTEATKSHKPAHGAALFRNAGDQSREQFLSMQENGADDGANGSADGAEQPAGGNPSAQAHLARAAANPKQSQTSLKPSLEDGHSSDGAETTRHSAGDGSSSSRVLRADTAGDQSGTVDSYLLGENLLGENGDYEPLGEAQNKLGSMIGDNQMLKVAFGFVGKQAKETLKMAEAFGHKMDENVIAPVKLGAQWLGSQVSENILQPLKQGAERFGSWVGDSVAKTVLKPAKQGAEQVAKFIGKTGKEVMQSLKQGAERFVSWTRENVSQPLNQEAKRFAGWVGGNVLQPAKNAGMALMQGATKLIDTAVAKPMRQAADLVKGSVEAIKQSVQKASSDVRDFFKGMTGNTATAPVDR